MPLTAADLLARYADRFGLTIEQVRFLRRVVRLARHERSAALLRRVVVPIVAQRLRYLLNRNETLGEVVSRRTEKDGSKP